MKKVLICGLKKDRKGTLELLQRQGAVSYTHLDVYKRQRNQCGAAGAFCICQECHSDSK